MLQVLLKWVNDVLEERRIRVRDFVEDLYDGQVLSELMGRYNSRLIIARHGLIFRATYWSKVHYCWRNTVFHPATNKTEDSSR